MALHWLSTVFDTLLTLQNFPPIAFFLCFKFGCIKSERLRCPDEMGRCNAVASQASHHGINLNPTGLFHCRTLGSGMPCIARCLAGPPKLVLCTARCSLGCVSNQIAFVAFFAFLLVKQCLLGAAEELAEPCLIKLILPFLIIPKLQYFPHWIIYNSLFWGCCVLQNVSLLPALFYLARTVLPPETPVTVPHLYYNQLICS